MSNSSTTDNTLQVAQWNFVTSPTAVPGVTTTILGHHYKPKPGQSFDNWESQNFAAAYKADSSVDPYVVGQTYTSTDIKSNLSMVNNDEEAGYVIMAGSKMYQVEGAPDLIMSTDYANATMIPGEIPKRTDRP